MYINLFTQDVSVQEMHIKVERYTSMKQRFLLGSVWVFVPLTLFYMELLILTWCPVSLSRSIHRWHVPEIHFPSNTVNAQQSWKLL